MKKHMFPSMIVLLLCCGFGSPVFSGSDIALGTKPSSAGMDLTDALQARSSVRIFSDREVPLDDLSRILWAGYGVTRPDGRRTIPTPWNRRMLNVYVFDKNGIYRYDAEKNMLKWLSDGDARKRITAFISSFAAKAPVIIVLSADLSAGPFYASKEEKVQNATASAGACAQSIYLMATARKVGTCIIAGFDTKETIGILKSGTDEIPLFIMPLGYAKDK